MLMINYYEVKSPYYGLIPARTKEEAMQKYTEVICDDYDGTLEEDMKEISQIEAFIKFASAVEEDGYGNKIETLGHAIDEFLGAYILLVDGALR